MVGLLVSVLALAQSVTPPVPLWAPKGVADDADSFVAFRGKFRIPLRMSGFFPASDFRIVGASEYLVWVDGYLAHDGPARYAAGFPEYQSNDGATTRILSDIKPFVWCGVRCLGSEIPINWKCARMPGYSARTKHISDILGWIDWCDTRQVWPNWQKTSFDDSKWSSPVEVSPGIGPITEAKTHPVRMNDLLVKPVASGDMTVNYGYERDEPATRFFLDDLDPKGVPPQGVWRRYDLGRVRLGRPKFTLDLPKGAVVEFALCEQLRHGRVAPWITLSGSTTCNMDHFVARGGEQEFMPFTPKGGRFFEVHVKSPGPIKFVKQGFLERTYYAEPTGTFTCDDPLLNKIWLTGVNTVRSCSEDSFVDCPTRERGQWTGDVASVAADIAGVSWSDMSLARRALVQAAQAVRSDGLVAGVGPGDPGYLSTYAAQWATACVHYWEMTGDKSLLIEMLISARKNMAAFEAQRSANGVNENLGWAFVDWGYVRNQGPTDMSLNIHYLMSVRSMVRWENAVGDPAIASHDQAVANDLSKLISGWINSRLILPGRWTNIGYQAASLALLADLVPKNEVASCIKRMKDHLMSCFPNNPDGPRLSDPSVSNEQVMTPYFQHFAFAALLNHGETKFVLDQYRKCWGWALGDGRTTWLEVFDTRWSHCHEWSGCPTWQLSRYALGLKSRYDLGDRTFDVAVQTGNLKHAEGNLPLTKDDFVHISWTKSASQTKLAIDTIMPIRLRFGTEVIEVRGHFERFLATR
jgi:alpha-L-rhamnosidase